MKTFGNIFKMILGFAMLVLLHYQLIDKFLIDIKGYPSEADKDTFVHIELTDFSVEYIKVSRRFPSCHIIDSEKKYSYAVKFLPRPRKREEFLNQIESEDRLYITYGTQIIHDTVIYPIIELRSNDTVYITAEEVFKDTRSDKIGAYLFLLPFELVLLIITGGCIYAFLPLNKPRKKSKSKKRR